MNTEADKAENGQRTVCRNKLSVISCRCAPSDMLVPVPVPERDRWSSSESNSVRHN